MSALIICDSVWAWETWAYAHDPIGLVRLNVVHEHYCSYYPRKVPRCPACEAGLPVRKAKGDLWDAILSKTLELEFK